LFFVSHGASINAALSPEAARVTEWYTQLGTLTWTYTGSISGLVGTGYGALVLTKTMLLGAALLLAAFNLKGARRAREPRAPAALRTRLPYLVEGEAILLVMILFTAATLSAQPPSVDQAAGDHATVGEVVEVFRPKVPSLHTPSVDIMRANRAEEAALGERSRDAYLWSNYSHNVAGLILLAMSLVALVGGLLRSGGGRHWPLGFVALAAFVYLRAAANEGTWPFGTVPLWKIDAEGIQHRIAALLVLALGVLEWRARARPDRGSLLPYVFPALGAAGAVLLLTHSHAAFQSKQSFLVQVTHTTMGALAALLVAGRWLELRLAPPAARVAGLAATAAMLMIALVLVFYREANLLISPN
jgi:putative copper resistance protein D